MPPPGLPKQVMPNHGTCDLAFHRTDSTVGLPHKQGEKTTHLAQSEAQALHGTCSALTPSTRLPSGASHHPHAPPRHKDHSILRKTGFRSHAPGHETEAQLPGFTAELLRGPKPRPGPEVTKLLASFLVVRAGREPPLASAHLAPSCGPPAHARTCCPAGGPVFLKHLAPPAPALRHVR